MIGSGIRLRWVPLSAYAADGKPTACSKGLAVQWVWGIVRWEREDFIPTRYRQRRFSTSLQEIWRNSDMHWAINEDARFDHCPYVNMLRNHKGCLIALWPLSARGLQIAWPLRCNDKIGLPIIV
jgi:hypothetical protein